jgi:hypothetical protein
VPIGRLLVGGLAAELLCHFERGPIIAETIHGDGLAFGVHDEDLADIDDGPHQMKVMGIVLHRRQFLKGNVPSAATVELVGKLLRRRRNMRYAIG